MQPWESLSTPTKCQICKIRESLYRCPACFILTCSLECCKSHKIKYECSGKRDRTCFVSLNKFTDSTLRSDYYFLEDVIQSNEAGKRLKREICDTSSNKRRKNEKGATLPGQVLLQLSQSNKEPSPSSNDNSGTSSVIDQDMNLVKDDMISPCKEVEVKESAKDTNTSKETGLICQDPTTYSQAKQKLVQQSLRRGVNLLLMPDGMQRSLLNKTTRFDQKKDTIIWKVELQLHYFSSMSKDNIDKEGSKGIDHTRKALYLDRVEESSTLEAPFSNLLQRSITHSAPTNVRFMAKRFHDSNKNGIKDNVCILMKKLPCKSSQPVYSHLDIKSTLADMLKGMTVIEFPTIEVVLDQDLKHFSVLIEEV